MFPAGAKTRNTDSGICQMPHYLSPEIVSHIQIDHNHIWHDLTNSFFCDIFHFFPEMLRNPLCQIQMRVRDKIINNAMIKGGVLIINPCDILFKPLRRCIIAGKYNLRRPLLPAGQRFFRPQRRPRQRQKRSSAPDISDAPCQ